MDVTVTRRHIKKDYFESNSSGYFGIGMTGPAGKQVELRENLGWVEWRYVGDIDWVQLYEIPNSVVGEGVLAEIIGEIPTGDINGVNTDFELAQIPSSSTVVRVYLNGVRQQINSHYTILSTTISFITAPFTDDSIVVDYTGFVQGVLTVFNEIPTGDIDGINADFVLSHIPVSLVVFLNGVRQQPITQYTITDDTITFIIPPYVDDSILVDYEYNS